MGCISLSVVHRECCVLFGGVSRCRFIHVLFLSCPKIVLDIVDHARIFDLVSMMLDQ